MATSEELKILFATGKKPTGADFASLIDGVKGDTGAEGSDGTDGFDGADGDSAYKIALANDFEGTEAEWLASLKGAKGETGNTGADGDKGETGEQGIQGEAGADGFVTEEMYNALIAEIEALKTP